MNIVFLALILVAFVTSAIGEVSAGGAMDGLTTAILKAAEGAVPLALGLVGVMALFLGVMKVAEAAGLLKGLARLLAPLLGRLFPEIPAGHPAFGAMAMNLSANLLGLGNAATPFGIRAMEELDRLNPVRGVASNAQVLFLVLNTAGLTLLPTKVIALRVALGASDPGAVVAPTVIASTVALIIGIVAARLLEGPRQEAFAAVSRAPVWAVPLAVAVLLVMVPVMLTFGRVIGPWLIPSVIAGLLAFGAWRRVAVYEVFVDGAKEGFAVAVRIIPYLVAILVAVAMLRQSGALEMILGPLGRLLAPLGVPAEALTMAVVRTLSGSGAYGLLASNLSQPATAPDTFTGLLLGTIYGSTETTFYVLAVYFGAVGVRRIRHALLAGLIADGAGLVAAVLACRMLQP